MTAIDGGRVVTCSGQQRGRLPSWGMGDAADDRHVEPVPAPSFPAPKGRALLVPYLIGSVLAFVVLFAVPGSISFLGRHAIGAAVTVVLMARAWPWK